MNPNKDYFIKIILNDIHKEIEKISYNYNNNKVEFKIGDTIYYYSNRQIIKGKILDIDDYTNGGLIPDALVYYWINPKSRCRHFIEKIRYRWAVIRKKDYIPGKLFFTNSCLAGDDFFRTKQEAITMEILHHSKFYLHELIELNKIQ